MTLDPVERLGRDPSASRKADKRVEETRTHVMLGDCALDRPQVGSGIPDSPEGSRRASTVRLPSRGSAFVWRKGERLYFAASSTGPQTSISNQKGR